MKRLRTPIQIEIDEAHEALVSLFHDFGLALDYSIESLETIERYLDENYPRNEGGSAFPAVRVGVKLFYIGAYLGECLRRRVGGNWSFNEKDPLGQIRAELQLDSGRLLRPIEEVMTRIEEDRPLGLLPLAQSQL